MKPPIKAIETEYNGYRFRSRLEARWAVFLDKLCVPYEYEMQGYELGNIWYLPDFWLRDQRCWLEIKGDFSQHDDASEKAQLLALSAGFPVYLLVGSVPYPCPGASQGDYDAGQVFLPRGEWDHGQFWCECSACGFLGIRYEGRSDRLPCKRCYNCNDLINGETFAVQKYGKSCPVHGENWDRKKCPRSWNGDKGHTPDAPRIVAAYAAARAARFEHGETPQPPR